MTVRAPRSPVAGERGAFGERTSVMALPPTASAGANGISPLPPQSIASVDRLKPDSCIS